MIYRIVVFLLFVGYTAGYSQSDDSYKPLADPTVLKEGIAAMAEKTATIETSFTQKKYLSILSNAIVSEGKMFFKKPKQLKWAYIKPYDYVIVFKADEILINDEGQVTTFDISSSKAFLEINEVIINSISGNILQEKQFEIRYFTGDSYYLASLTPRADQMKDYIDVIDVYLDKNNFTVASVKLHEKGEDYTWIEFFDKKLNVTITDETFDDN